MKEMLEDLQRHRSDRLRRVVWLQSVTPQFEVMGIVLVGHFKDLLPLFYDWLHAHDEPTQQLVMNTLSFTNSLCEVNESTFQIPTIVTKLMKLILTYDGFVHTMFCDI
jgi:hypothetical protein